MRTSRIINTIDFALLVFLGVADLYIKKQITVMLTVFGWLIAIIIAIILAFDKPQKRRYVNIKEPLV